MRSEDEHREQEPQDDEHRVNEQTMPDGVHPNGEGWRRLYGECIRPELEKLSHPCTDAYKSYD